MRAPEAGAAMASGVGGGGGGVGGQQQISHLFTTVIRHQLSPARLLESSAAQSWTQLEDSTGATRNSNHQLHHHLHTSTTYNSHAPISAQLVATPNDQEDTSNRLVAGSAALASSATGGDWWRDYWSRQPFPSGYTQSSITLLACLITTIIFLIVVGNLLVCIAIFTEKSLKPTQNWFIASLAVSDMMLGLVVMPFSLARELMGFWIFGTLWCDIHEAIDVLLTTASINTLCLISLDRYWSITQAISYLKKRTPRRGAFMIAFVWIFSAAVSLPPLFGWKKPTPSIVATPSQATDNTSSLILAEGGQSSPPIEDVTNSTGVDLEMYNSPTTALPVPVQASAEYPMCQLSDDVGYVLYSALGSFFLPCAVMVFTYIKIFLAARSRARRAINKQTRVGGGVNKRAQGARRSQATVQGTTDSSKPQLSGLTSDAASRKSNVIAHQQEVGESRKVPLQRQLRSAEPPIKGKIVVVERRKSMAVLQGTAGGLSSIGDADQAAAMKAVCSTFSLAASVKENRVNRATYTCSELVAGQGTGCIESTGDTSSELAGLTGGQSSTTLTTSDAKVASRSVLNSSISNDSSMITVMNASMTEMPVTHFNFNPSAPTPEQTTCHEQKQLDKPNQGLTCQGPSDSISSPAGLLNALRNHCDSQQALDSGGESIPSPVPHIVVDEKQSFDRGDKQVFTKKLDTIQPLNNATNETCFMTMEEDSDIFDAQAGRTVVMMVPNRTGGIMNPNDMLCNSLACRHPRQHTHSASSYCGSSLTINEDEDLDDCVDDEMMTDDCNGLSISCGLDQYSHCLHCQECDRERSGETGGSMLSGQVSYGRGLNQLSPSRLAADSPTTRSQAQGASLRGHRQHECFHHHGGYDDNLSITECRSNDDSSSFVGHDVLDATERFTSPSKKKPSVVASSTEKSGGVASGLVGYLAERKRSTIGSRLSRLGGNALLSNETGGLLDIASRGQAGGGGGGTGGTRNLKALRQNFFMKLNQLTAKSATKSSKTKSKNMDLSVSGVHSSESCEASVDCATTSNVHSAEYQQETTTNDELQSGFKESSSRGGQEHDSEDFSRRRGKQSQDVQRNLEEGTCEGVDSSGIGSRKNDHLGDTSKNNFNSNNNHDDDDERKTDKSFNRSVMSRDPNDNIAKLRSNIVDLNDSKLQTPTTTKAAGKSSNQVSADSKKKLSLKQNGLKKTSAAYQMNHTSGSGSLALNSPGAPVGGGSQTSRAYLASDNERHKRKLAKARERRATLILGLIMAAFICSWMPFFTFYVIRAVCVSCREYMNPRFEAFIFWMGYCNSAINPIIYTIFNRDFRKAFRKILFKCL